MKKNNITTVRHKHANHARQIVIPALTEHHAKSAKTILIGTQYEWSASPTNENVTRRASVTAKMAILTIQRQIPVKAACGSARRVRQRITAQCALTVITSSIINADLSAPNASIWMEALARTASTTA